MVKIIGRHVQAIRVKSRYMRENVGKCDDFKQMWPRPCDWATNWHNKTTAQRDMTPQFSKKSDLDLEGWEITHDLSDFNDLEIQHSPLNINTVLSPIEVVVCTKPEVDRPNTCLTPVT